ncbi:protein FAM50A [Macrochelys suwanniensis]
MGKLRHAQSSQRKTFRPFPLCHTPPHCSLGGRSAKGCGILTLSFPLCQHHSFYDFIVTKARGKSGPLFNFDVHEDVRLLSDATVEKDESHAGKVVLRSWYEKNKHIFPASRWSPTTPRRNGTSTRSDERC